MVLLEYGHLVVVAGILRVFQADVMPSSRSFLPRRRQAMVGKVEHIAEGIVYGWALAYVYCLYVSLGVGEEVQNVVGILKPVHIFGGGYGSPVGYFFLQ